MILEVNPSLLQASLSQCLRQSAVYPSPGLASLHPSCRSRKRRCPRRPKAHFMTMGNAVPAYGTDQVALLASQLVHINEKPVKRNPKALAQTASDALRLLAAVASSDRSKEVHFTPKQLGLVVGGSALAGEWRAGMKLLRNSPGHGIELDTELYDAVLSPLGRFGYYQEAVEVLHYLQKDGLEPTPFQLTKVLGSLVKARQFEKAVGFFQKNLAEGASVFSYSEYIKALAGLNRVNEVMAAVQEMKDKQVEADNYVHSAVVTALRPACVISC
ncbi:unnamed protein product [Chrysoparadoxa australica]